MVSTLTICRRPARMTGPSLRFDADAIVYGSADPLLAAEVAFGSLHRNMSKQELDLVQFSSGGMAQFSA